MAPTQMEQYSLMSYVARIQEMLQQLQDLDGPFTLPDRGKRLLLAVVQQRPLTATQRSWVDVENPVSTIFLSQGRPDPGLWQRLVGLLACGVPHPDHPGAHLVDQHRLPLACQAAAIRRGALLARLNVATIIDAAAAGEAAAAAAAAEPPLPPKAAPPAAAPCDDAGAAGAAAGGCRAAAPGILLSEPDEDTMLLHRLCEAEDFLDTCLHMLLGLGGGDTPLLRRAVGGIMPRGTLLGDALAELLQPALAADLRAMAVNLRNRTYRDRIITLGVDLADKARTYASHRPEFTLTRRDRRGAAINGPGTAAARAAAAAAAIAARLTGAAGGVGGAGRGSAAAGVTVEQGVMPLTSMMAAAAAAVVGPPAPGAAAGGSGGGKASGPDDDEDMDAIRARRRAAAVAQAEAAVAAVQAAAKAAASAAAAAAANTPPPSTADAQPPPSPGGTPSRKWHPAKAVGLSKSAVIRMEMLAGRPVGASVTSVGTASTALSPPITPAAGSLVSRSNSNRASGMRNERSPVGSPQRGSRTIAFADGGAAAAAAAAASPTTASPSPPRGARGFGAASRRASLRSQSSLASSSWARGGSPGGMNTRALLAESSAFSFAVRGADLQPSPKAPAGAAGAGGQLRADRSSATALSDVSDPDGAPHSPHGGGGDVGAMGGRGGGSHALVNNFLYMVPPGFLSAGKVLNPANFPWPREVPSQESVQVKADFILRATLPNLNAMPQLPDIVFGPLGDPPGSQEPSPEPSLMSHTSINSSRALALAEAAAAAAAAVAAGAAEGSGGAAAAAAMGSPDSTADLPSSAFGGAGGAAAAAAAALGAGSGGGASTGSGVAWSSSGGVVDGPGPDAAGGGTGLPASWSRQHLLGARGNTSARTAARLGGGVGVGPQRSALSITGLPSGGGLPFPSMSMSGGPLPDPAANPGRAQPRRNPSVLSSVRGLYSPAGSAALDKEALAAAVAARRERRTQATVRQLLGYDVLQDGLVHSGGVTADLPQHLPGLAEGADGEEGEEGEEDDATTGTDPEAAAAAAEDAVAAAALAAKRVMLRGSVPLPQLLSMTLEAASKSAPPPEPKGLAMAFTDFGVKRKSLDGDVGSDVDSVTNMPQRGGLGTPIGISGGSDDGGGSASDPPTPGRGGSATGTGSGHAIRPSIGSGGGRASGSSIGGGGGGAPRPQFHVTTRQLNIFMGAHLRRSSSTHTTSAAMRARDKRKGLTLMADGILVTPFGVQVVREVEEEGEDSDTAPSRRGAVAVGYASDLSDCGGGGGAAAGRRGSDEMPCPLGDGLRRTKTVVLREFANAVPFEEQYDFRKSVWLPPDQRQHMLDGYDLAAELAAGRAGELVPPFMQQLLAVPPEDSPFLQDFEVELTRTRIGVQRRQPQMHADRQRAWSRLSRGASVMSRGSGTGSASGAASGGGSDSSAAPRRRSSRREMSRYSRRRFPVADSAFLNSDEESEVRAAASRAASRIASRAASTPRDTYVDDLFDEDYFGGVNIAQAAAVAAAAAAAASSREDPTVLQLMRMGAPGFQVRRPPAHLASAAAAEAKNGISPWSSNPGDGVTPPPATAAAATGPSLRHLNSGGGASVSAMSVASGRGAVRTRTPGAASMLGGAAEAAHPAGALLQRTLALEAAVGASVYDLEVGRLPNLTEAAELLGAMFASHGPSRPTSARLLRHPRTRARKRGNLRTGTQLLQDPLLVPQEAASPQPAPSPSPPPPPVASGAADDEDAGSEQSVAPSDAGSTSSLRVEATLSAFGVRSPRRAGTGDGATAQELQQQRREEEQHAALLRDEGVRRQLEALRAMWTSDPYSARPGVDPESLSPPPPNLAAAAAASAAAATAAEAAAAEGGAGAAILAGRVSPVRIGAGLARALAEARVEQWALYDKAVEHMAKEFARSMQQLRIKDGEGGAAGEDGEDGDGPGPGMYGGFQDSGLQYSFDPARPSSGSSAGPGPGSAAMRRSQYDAATRRRRGGGGGGRRGSASVHDSATPPSGRSTPLTGHASRGLLDALEEALAASLDPTSLTGLTLDQYDDHLSELMRRLMVAPAASKYMFWKKVQTVQQLRQRMMEDRALGEQLRSITWAGTFNADKMAPPGTDPATGRAGPFAAEALAHSDARRRSHQLEESRIAAVRKLRAAQARAAREQRAAAAAEDAASTAPAAAVPPLPSLDREPSLAPAPAAPPEDPALHAGGRRSGGELIGRRAAWVPLISSSPPLDPLQPQLQHQHYSYPLSEPPPVEERIVLPARLQPKPAAAAVTASARDILPRRDWRRYRRRKSAAAAAAGAIGAVVNFATDGLRPHSAPRTIGFRSTMFSAHPDDMNRMLDHTRDGVTLVHAAEVAAMTEGRPLWCGAAALGVHVCSRSEPGHGGTKRRFRSYYRRRCSDDDEYDENDEYDEYDENGRSRRRGAGGEDWRGGGAGGEGDEEGGDGYVYGVESGGFRYADDQLRHMHLRESYAELRGNPDAFGGWGVPEHSPRRPHSQPTTRHEQLSATSAATASSPRLRQSVPMYMLPTASAVARTTGVVPARSGVIGGPGAGWFVTAEDIQAPPPGEPTSDGGDTRPPPDQIDLGNAPEGDAAAAAAAAALPASGGVTPRKDADGYAGEGAQDDVAERDAPAAAADAGKVYGGGGGGGRRRVKRPRLTAAKLQLALARRAELRAALTARGELLELDEMDLDELEEEADLVDRLVEASIRVYGASLARRAAQMDGTVAPATGALAVPGEGVVLAGRGRALGWVPPGPTALQRGDAMQLLPTSPWHTPTAGYGAAAMAATRSGGGAAAAPQFALAGVPAGGGGRLISGRPPKPQQSLPLGAGDDPEHRHLPYPTGQLRPVGTSQAPLAPLTIPKPLPAVYLQPGSLRIPSPVPGDGADGSGGGAAADASLLRSSAPAGLGPMVALGAALPSPPTAALRPLRSPITGPAGLLPLVSPGAAAAGSRAATPAAADITSLPAVLHSGSMTLPPRGDFHPHPHLPPVALPPGHSGSIPTPTTPLSSRSPRVLASAGSTGRPPHLDPIPDPPRPRSAGMPAAAAAAAAAPPPSTLPLAFTKTGSAGSLTAAVVTAATAATARPQSLRSPRSPPTAVPPLDWVRARSPATGLVGLVGIGETPSVAAAAAAAGPVTGIAGQAAPLAVAALPTRSGKSLSPSRLSPTPSGGEALPWGPPPPEAQAAGLRCGPSTGTSVGVPGDRQ